MANRPVYIALEKFPYFERVNVEFKFYPGFSTIQKVKCIRSLHEEFLKLYPEKSVLEISSKSETPLGVNLSAFNLKIYLKNSNKSFSVESAFQSSKVFEHGGPFTDLLYKSSREAKKDLRLRNSGTLKAFKYFDREFPPEPKTYFYDWLYINALNLQTELAAEVLNYDAFTDIEFNPQKSINCQAKAAAIFVGLSRAGLIKSAVENKENFLKIVYQGEC